MNSAAAVARMLKIDPRRVRRFAEEGRFPNAVPYPRANGTDWRIPDGDVEALKAQLREEHAARKAVRA